jgi:hypothetical protein
MASKRTEGPTPNGGAYAIGVYVRFLPDGGWREVDEVDADGLIIGAPRGLGRRRHPACRSSRILRQGVLPSGRESGADAGSESAPRAHAGARRLLSGLWRSP